MSEALRFAVVLAAQRGHQPPAGLGRTNQKENWLSVKSQALLWE